LAIDDVDIGADRLFELAGGTVYAPADLLFGQVGEEALDLIDPRCRGWREVDAPNPRVFFECLALPN
jgi:hypothetical protein